MKKGAIIGIVCGIVATVVAGIGVGAALIWNSAEMKLIRGTTKLFADAANHGADFNKEMGLGEAQKGSNENYKAVFDFDIYDVEGLEDFSLCLDGTILCDMKNEKLKEEMSISLSYYELLSFQMAVDKTDVYLDIPALYDGSICFDSQKINEQYNNSIFKDYLGEELQEEVSFNFFESASYTTDFFGDYKKDILKTIRNAEITGQDGVLAIEVGGKSVNCKGYFVTFKKDDINAILESLYEESGVTGESAYLLDDDLELLVYLDKKCVIRQIQTEADICLEGVDETMSLALRFAGEENSFDVLKGKIGTTIEGEAVEFDFDYAAVMEGKEMQQNMQLKAKMTTTDILGLDYDAVWNADDGSFEMDMEMNVADENYVLEMAGDVETDSKDSFAINFRDCAIYYDDVKLGSLDASCRIEPLNEEISMPTGKTYPIFEFTEEDLATFALECYEKLEEFSGMFEGMEDFY